MCKSSESNSAPDRTAEEQVRAIFLNLPACSEEVYRQLSFEDRNLVDVLCFIEEVDNGGLDQFFYNSIGDHAAETLESLEQIGATETLAILRDAFALFPGGAPSRNGTDRQNELIAIRFAYCREPKDLDQCNSELVALDERFFSRSEDLYALMLSKWRAAKTTRPAS